MITIYLHIGRPKTGSKTIQHFLSENTEGLKESNFLYPQSDRQGFIHHPFFWSHWPTADNETRKQFIVNKDKIVNNLRTEIQTSGTSNIILSSEDAYIASSAEYANSIRKSLADFNVKIIVYVRRQDHVLESSYNQEIKLSENLITEPFSEYMKRRNRFLDYTATLAPWAKSFGNSSLIVRVFEKEQLHAGLINDFLDALNIADRHHFIMPENQLNTSLEHDATEFKKIINSLNITKNKKALLLRKLQEYSTTEKKEVRQALFTPRERLRIINEYEQTNAEVAKKFLGRANGKLFHEQVDKNQPTYDGLSFHSFLHLIGHLLIQFQCDIDVANQRLNTQLQRINSLELSIQETNETIRKLELKTCR